MKLHNSTENWSALLAGSGKLSETDDSFLNDWAEELRRRVLNRLFEAGVDYKPVYTQRVGTQVIVQQATDAEREAFYAAVDAELPGVVEAAVDDWAEMQRQLAEQQ